MSQNNAIMLSNQRHQGGISQSFQPVPSGYAQGGRQGDQRIMLDKNGNPVIAPKGTFDQKYMHDRNKMYSQGGKNENQHSSKKLPQIQSSSSQRKEKELTGGEGPAAHRQRTMNSS